MAAHTQNRKRAVADIPFQLPAESREIILDFPIPVSTNRIWRSGRGRVFKSKEYVFWQRACDAAILVHRQYPRNNKIVGPFEIAIYLSREHGVGDGDNRVKSCLDYLQSREIVANDRDCQKGRWEWVPEAEAPLGCRVHLRSLHQ